MQVMEKMGKHAKISIAYTADPRWDGPRLEAGQGGGPGGDRHARKVLGWMREKQLNCATMKILVFDEADQMMDTDATAWTR